jgi:glycosyltransferase involved in cell wall biosynthesis
LNDTRGTGRVAKNLFAELDRELTNHSSGTDLQQLFLVDESRVDIYLYSSIQWADKQKLTKAALIILDVLPVSLEYLFPKPRIREWQTKYKDFALQAKIVITISEWSASEIIERIGIPKERLYVVPLGIEKKNAVDINKDIKSLHKKYFIFIGSNDYHKNLDIVVDALCDESLLAYHLVVIGDNFTSAQKNNWKRILGNRIFFYGHLEDNETFQLLSGAEALLLPSFNEGFGLPPFEAAIHDVPSICSDRPAMNQLLKEAALFADPTKQDEWISAMNMVINREKSVFKKLEKAKILAENYKWKDFLKSLLGILRSSIASDDGVGSNNGR